MAIPSLSINISTRQLSQVSLISRVKALLKKYHVKPSQLIIELTESALISETGYSKAVLQSLRGMGIKIHIDDFGTGYSSLAYIKKINIDRLKIDRGFVKDIPENIEDREIVSTIITMAHQLGIKTIAEGVENIEHETFLKKAGCDQVQGFLYSRPLESDVFERRFAKNIGE